MNLKFAAQAFELPGASQPFPFVDCRLTKLCRAVGHDLFEDLISGPIGIISESMELEGFVNGVCYCHVVTATSHIMQKTTATIIDRSHDSTRNDRISIANRNAFGRAGIN